MSPLGVDDEGKRVAMAVGRWLGRNMADDLTTRVIADGIMVGMGIGRSHPEWVAAHVGPFDSEPEIDAAIRRILSGDDGRTL